MKPPGFPVRTFFEGRDATLSCEFVAEHRARFEVAADPSRAVWAADWPGEPFYAQRRPPSRRALGDGHRALAGYDGLATDGRRKPESLYGAATIWDRRATSSAG